MSFIDSVHQSRFWRRLSKSEWDEGAARHLLLRAGISARPELLARALASDMSSTVGRLLGTPERLETPQVVEDRLSEERRLLRARRKSKKKAERRKISQQVRRLNKKARVDFNLLWLSRAADPSFAAQEKFVMFLQNVLVVSSQSVPRARLLIDYQNILRQHGQGDYRALIKKVTRSPAMIQYLNLDDNEAQAPNENFARELLELFTLGEGNYTERDIKEAARAFTGYTAKSRRFVFEEEKHDASEKSVFGQTGKFHGDDIVDLIFDQPASTTFLPGELIRYYLTDGPFPREATLELGSLWRDSGFNSRMLLETLFNSELFYANQFRGEKIKSPLDFLLGTTQDLRLDTPVFPSASLDILKKMGQELLRPPNVGGWSGARSWVNTPAIRTRQAWLARILGEADDEDEGLSAVDLEFVRRLGNKDNEDYFASESHWRDKLEITGPEAALAYAQRTLANPLDSHEQSLVIAAAKRSTTPVSTVFEAILNHPKHYLC